MKVKTVSLLARTFYGSTFINAYIEYRIRFSAKWLLIFCVFFFFSFRCRAECVNLEREKKRDNKRDTARREIKKKPKSK